MNSISWTAPPRTRPEPAFYHRRQDGPTGVKVLQFVSFLEKEGGPGEAWGKVVRR